MRYLILLLLISCNPVKRVLKDPVKFEQVKEAVIRSGACVNDTIVVTKDSIVNRDSIIEKSITVPCRDFDTLFDGTAISVKSGILTYKHTCKQRDIYRTVTNNIRDRKFEDLLKSDIKHRDSIVSSQGVSLKEKDVQIKSLTVDIRWEKFKLWIAITVACIIIFRKPLLGLFWPKFRGK